ncbi:ATP-binding protein [Streptomyces nitrosporeus]|uniref:ATP-binding protein n=1 Tax=Streptomyces nitrosporeus TaxID=28894 RepID=UPI003322DA1C
MDPTNREPEDHPYGGPADDAARRRPPRDPLTPDFAHQPPQRARAVRLTAGEFLLTVNPVDGSEIEPCPPGEHPDAPVRRTAAERAARERDAAPPVPPGPPAPQPLLLERREERERLVRLLARGRSVRLTGPAGSGRTALLDAVAADCADLAPDGVVRLSGHRRTTADLLYGLFETVYASPGHRPDREELGTLLRGVGAVVVLDDLELGGSALDELLDATPECAFLFAATPDTAAPAADSGLEEVFLAGLGRDASVELLEHVVGRALTEEEANWAGDLWFESEGLPLRFVQAGALLRQLDGLRAAAEDLDGYDPDDAPFGPPVPPDVSLPSLGEGAAPAALLASRMSEAARETLRFAVALGGEVPHQAHLPALVGDTHADAALGELSLCGLLSPAGPRYRLAAGVLAQLEASGYDEDAAGYARNAAQHYAWWAGHPSVTPERAAAEADAVLASMNRLLAGDRAGAASTVVLLARSASPAFAAGMRWGHWEKALRTGQGAARTTGEVAEEAYFHHELGVLALLTGNLARARTELETSIGMRGALADKSGAVAGRRALALVTDRSGGPARARQTPFAEEAPAAGHAPVRTAALPGPPVVVPVFEEPSTLVSPRVAPAAGEAAAQPSGPRSARLGILRGARRNMVAIGAGALLAAVLGTVVTLGATSDSEEPAGRDVTTERTADPDSTEDGLPADEPAGGTPVGETSSGPGSPAPSASGDATPSEAASPDPGATETAGTTPGAEDPSGGTSESPGSPKPTRTTPEPGEPVDPDPGPDPDPEPTEEETPPETTEPTTPTDAPTDTPTAPENSSSASGPAGSAPASATAAPADSATTGTA